MKFKNYKDYKNFLIENKNQKTSLFNKKIISTKFKILGLKIPFMRTLAKQIVKNNCQSTILCVTDFEYYEEILIYGFVLAQIKIDENERIVLIDKFIDCFDNWSVVDSFCASLKTVKKNKELYFEYIKKCLGDSFDFKVRFAIVLCMDYYLSEKNLEEILLLVLKSERESYYIQMAIAWLMATSLAKNFEITKKFLEENKMLLTMQTKKMIVSKCQDSFRIEKQNKVEIKNILIEN